MTRALNNVSYCIADEHNPPFGSLWLDPSNDLFILTSVRDKLCMARLKDGRFHELSEFQCIGTEGFERFRGHVEINTETES